MKKKSIKVKFESLYGLWKGLKNSSSHAASLLEGGWGLGCRKKATTMQSMK